MISLVNIVNKIAIAFMDRNARHVSASSLYRLQDGEWQKPHH